jgi:hypothetical protein
MTTNWSPIDPTLTTYKYLSVHLNLYCKNDNAFDRGKHISYAIPSSNLIRSTSGQDK